MKTEGSGFEKLKTFFDKNHSWRNGTSIQRLAEHQMKANLSLVLLRLLHFGG